MILGTNRIYGLFLALDSIFAEQSEVQYCNGLNIFLKNQTRNKDLIIIALVRKKLRKYYVDEMFVPQVNIEQSKAYDGTIVFKFYGSFFVCN